ncbi:hypothetical protein Q4I32_007171 [Leishmania shawi]|uniref:Uncharacterized protein n=1 Tax=Leishmania shawi TaxID=5680 RepID=A0AAW3BEH2_9TRYP
MVHPSQRGRSDGRYRTTVLCAFLALALILAALGCTPVRAQHRMRELEERERNASENADKIAGGSGHKDYEAATKDGLFRDADMQTESSSDSVESSDMVTVSQSGAVSSSLETVDAPSTEQGSSSSVPASSARTQPNSSSSSESSDPSIASSFSEINKGEQSNHSGTSAIISTTTTSPSTTTTTATPTTSHSTGGDGKSTVVAFLFFIVFIAALIMYSGRLCPSKCPFFDYNGGRPGSGLRLEMQPQLQRYTNLRGNEGGRDIFVEMGDKPTQRMRDSGAHHDSGAMDSFSFLVQNNPAAVYEPFGSSGFSAGPEAAQAPQTFENSLKSLRKGMRGHTSTMAVSSPVPATTTGTLGFGTGSPLACSTADTRSSYTGTITTPLTKMTPRVEEDWEW